MLKNNLPLCAEKKCAAERFEVNRMKRKCSKLTALLLTAVLLTQNMLLPAFAEEVTEVFETEDVVSVEEVVEITEAGEEDEAVSLEAYEGGSESCREEPSFIPEEIVIDGVEEVIESADGEETEPEEEEVFVDEETGLILGNSAADIVKESRSSLFLGAAEASYDGRKVFPAARNQGSYNTCWAFSTAALAEASMVKAGKETADSVDYSELGIA